MRSYSEIFWDFAKLVVLMGGTVGLVYGMRALA